MSIMLDIVYKSLMITGVTNKVAKNQETWKIAVTA